MRLIQQLRRVEAGAAAAREKRPAAVGLIWSRHEGARVDPEELRAGEYVACDIRVEGAAPCAPEGSPAAVVGDAPVTWSMSERVTRDAQDLGTVRDMEGARLGRVMEIDGSMISIAYDEPSSSIWRTPAEPGD